LKESESKHRDESKLVNLSGLHGSEAGDLDIPDDEDFVQEKGEGRFTLCFDIGGEGVGHDCMGSSGRE